MDDRPAVDDGGPFPSRADRSAASGPHPPFWTGCGVDNRRSSFTGDALAIVLDLLPLLVGMAAMTTGFSLVVAFIQARLAGVRLSRMALATFPLAPVEAAIIAESVGQPAAPVVIAQSLRIAAVVVVIPAILYLIDGAHRGAVPSAAGAEAFLDPWLTPLPIIGLVGGLLFKRLNWANPFFLGPLTIAAMLTAGGVALPHYPLSFWPLHKWFSGRGLDQLFRRAC